MNEKQQNLAELLKRKKVADKRAQDIVLKLIEPGVSREYLLSQVG